MQEVHGPTCSCGDCDDYYSTDFHARECDRCHSQSTDGNTVGDSVNGKLYWLCLSCYNELAAVMRRFLKGES